MDELTEQFFGIADELVREEAEDLLRKQMDAVMLWRAKMREKGKPDGLDACIRQMHRETRRNPLRVGPALAAGMMAIWKQLEQEGRIG